MKLMRILHKWLGLLVGLQVLLWTASGLVFAWLDHDAVTGEGSVRPVPRVVLAPDAHVAEPDGWIHHYAGAGIRDVTLMPLHDRWIYRIRLADRVELRRAEDGAPFAINRAVVRGLAVERYAGDGALRAISLRGAPTLEARDAGSVWQAEFDDAGRTSLYFAADDGRFVAARTDAWRLFDLFWMLHTMDYRGRDNFNHPVVILFATGALWLGITGGVLLFGVFRGPGARGIASDPECARRDES